MADTPDDFDAPPRVPDALRLAADRRTLTQVLALIQQYPPTRQREMLEQAWLTAANMERAAALHIPGGYVSRRADQIETLVQLIEITSNSEPDLEAERLLAEHRYREAFDRAGFDVDDDTRAHWNAQPPSEN